MAHTTQMIGTGKTGYAATDDCNFFAGVGTGLMQFQTVLKPVITDKLFYRIYTDMVLDFVAVTTVFTRRRADPAHDGRERIGIGHTAEGIFLPGGSLGWFFDATHDIQPATDILT